MARKQQNDPLRYAANLTALAAAVYLGVTALLRLAVGPVSYTHLTLPTKA